MTTKNAAKHLSILLIAIASLLGGCATSSMSAQMKSEIPANATSVQLLSELPADEFYREAYQMLKLKGFRISESNTEMRSLSTEGKRVGNSQTMLRISLFVDATEGGSELAATAEYELMPDDWRPVAYTHSGTKYKVGYEELVLLISELPHREVNYVVDEERARHAFGI